MENKTTAAAPRASGKGKEWLYGIIAEGAFYAFLYYVQYLLGVRANLWVSSFVLFALLNISIAFCPLLRKCFR